MTFILATLAGLAALDVLAWRYGAETRPGFDGRPDDRRRNL